ncbi:MAG TPA: hypothetical protein VH143_15980 [Kofleriaceae bacterium]|nr:hypothetical protein [Kofleriaceae bacterium]
MARRFARVVLHCSIALGIGACDSDSSAVPCTMDDQCASHFCQADDTCAPLPTADAGMSSDGTAPPDGGSGGDLCTPNLDGIIEANEIPLAAGKTANYLIATNPTWNTAGSAATNNNRDWDLSGALSGDTNTPVTLAAPSGAWWAGDFGSATYATVLSSSSTLLGVFHVDTTGVTLLGVVSPSGGAGSTELTYSPPAKILAVPFMAGSTWTSTSNVTGTADGVVAAYTEEYDSTVDEVGTMKTPYGSFPVLRVATNLLRDSIADSRTFAWVAECFGSVAQATSQAYPDTVPTGDFSNPAEVWRITP